MTKRFLTLFLTAVLAVILSPLLASSTEAAAEFTTDKSVLAGQCNTDYGYQDIVKNIRSESMAKMYKAIDNAEKDFFLNSNDATHVSDSFYSIKNIDYTTYGLTEEQAAQVYTLYKHDHPLFFWWPADGISLEGPSLILECLPEYASGKARNDEYQRICSGIKQYTDYCKGADTNYTYATASLHRMTQNIDYAFDDGDASWAHSIVGVFDSKHRLAVCEGYAKAYQLLLNYFGVPNAYVVGFAGGNNSDENEHVMHAWNLVEMDDGKYYGVDATWCDNLLPEDKDPFGVQDGYEKAEIQALKYCDNYLFRTNYKYHLKGSEVFDQAHWPFTPDNVGAYYMYKLPSLSSSAYVPTVKGQAPGEYICENDLGTNITDDTGDWVFIVTQNDGLHRTADIVWTTDRKQAEIAKSGSLVFPKTVTCKGVSYDVTCFTMASIPAGAKNVTVPEGIESIVAPHDFGNNNAILDNISLPASLRHIDYPYLPFIDTACITVASGNPYIKSVDGILYSKDGKKLLRFPSRKEAASFTIPSTVTDIYPFAFERVSGLKKLVIPNSVERINVYSFNCTKNLDKLDVPSSVKYLPRCIMCESSIRSISIPAGTSFCNETLMYAYGLESIAVASGNKCGFVYDGALYMNDYTDAIDRNHGLSLVAYPCARVADAVHVKDHTFIAGGAFDGTKQIGTVVIPEHCDWDTASFTRSGIGKLQIDKNNSSYRYDNGAILSKDGKILYTYLAGCRNKTYSVPSTVTTISNISFTNNPYLESVTMPDTVTMVRSEAFKNCTALKSIHLSDNIRWETDYGPDLLCDNYMSVFSGCTSLEKVNIPKASSHLPCWTFEDCISLKEIEIPANIETIGEYAFWNTPNLDKVVIGNPRIHLPDKQYMNSATWDGVFQELLGKGDDWDEKEKKLFIYCDPGCDLAKFVQSMEGSDVGCNAWIIDKNTQISSLPSSGKCGDDISWSLSEDKKTLTLSGSGEMAAYDGAAPPPWFLRWAGTIEHITVGEGIKNIGAYAFYDFTALKDIQLPASLERIGDYAFYNCKALNRIRYSGTESLWQTVEVGWSGKEGVDPVLRAAFEYGDRDYRESITFSDVPPGKWFSEAVSYVAAKGYMAGVGNGSFAPNGTVTRATIVQILYAIEGKPAVSRSSRFRDVASGKWYSAAVTWASYCDVVAGYEDGTFRPDKPISRQELATILYSYTLKLRSIYSGQNGNIESFPDYKSVKNYAKDAMRWAVGNKLISGTKKGLEPTATATRAQIAVILKAYDMNLLKGNP